MFRRSVERRLTEVHDRLKRARADLVVLDEQLTVFTDAADDDRIRALVADDRSAAHEQRDSQRHADAMTRSRQALVADIARLEQAQDDLLGQLSTESR